jgi:hypothetical protein
MNIPVPIDLRGKNAKEVAAIIKKYGLGGDTRDLTQYVYCCEEATCVYIDESKKGSRGISFVMRHGQTCQPRTGENLLYYRYKDGTAQWELVNTLDLVAARSSGLEKHD